MKTSHNAKLKQKEIPVNVPKGITKLVRTLAGEAERGKMDVAARLRASRFSEQKILRFRFYVLPTDRLLKA